MNFNNSKPHALIIVEELIYNPIGLYCKNIRLEIESKEYEACEFTMNNHLIKFRSGKITPTKVGQFVTFWKRIGSGPIMPYDISDTFDFLVISVRNKNHFGQFIFPKYALYKYGLVSKGGKGGKRAIRIYPPWDLPKNKQAQRTQQWQLMFFFEIDPDRPLDKTRVLKLFNLTNNLAY